MRTARQPAPKKRPPAQLALNDELAPRDTTNRVLDALAAKYPKPNGEPASDYALARLLDTSASAISNYRHGRSNFDEERACRAAQLLGVNPAPILLALQRERSTCQPARAALAEVIKKLGGVAALALVVFGMWSSQPDMLMAFPLFTLDSPSSILIMRSTETFKLGPAIA